MDIFISSLWVEIVSINPWILRGTIYLQNPLTISLVVQVHIRKSLVLGHGVPLTNPREEMTEEEVILNKLVDLEGIAAKLLEQIRSRVDCVSCGVDAHPTHKPVDSVANVSLENVDDLLVFARRGLGSANLIGCASNGILGRVGLLFIRHKRLSNKVVV